MTIIKYFESQVFGEDGEISYSEAVNRTWYVACYYLEGNPDFAEIIGNGKLERVVYYNRKWPDEFLLKNHLNRYNEFPFEVVSSLIEIDGKHVRDIFYCNSAGQLQAITEEHISYQGDPLMQVRMDSQRNIYGKIEYEYNPLGELSLVRELTQDGTVMSEEYYD
jgi:hypothetical protein